MVTVLGVDGGQSGIRLRSSAQPDLIEMTGVSRLEGDTTKLVANAVAQGWNQGNFAPVDRIVLGLTTAPTDHETATLLSELIYDITGAPEIWIADDSVTSHAGALSAEPGVSLIAGTGIACLAVRADGDSRTIDGDGYLLGDAGSGFWIGSRGISAVLKELDGRGNTTDLTARAEERFGGLEHLAARIHSLPRPVNDISQFAQEVLAMAEQGDPLSLGIVDHAARELFATARVALTWVAKDAPLALGGKLLGPNTVLFARLVELLVDEGLSFRPTDASSLDGAVLIGTGDSATLYHGLIHMWKEGTPA